MPEESIRSCVRNQRIVVDRCYWIPKVGKLICPFAQTVELFITLQFAD